MDWFMGPLTYNPKPILEINHAAALILPVSKQWNNDLLCKFFLLQYSHMAHIHIQKIHIPSTPS